MVEIFFFPPWYSKHIVAYRNAGLDIVALRGDFDTHNTVIGSSSHSIDGEILFVMARPQFMTKSDDLMLKSFKWFVFVVQLCRCLRYDVFIAYDRSVIGGSHLSCCSLCEDTSLD